MSKRNASRLLGWLVSVLLVWSVFGCGTETTTAAQESDIPVLISRLLQNAENQRGDRPPSCDAYQQCEQDCQEASSGCNFESVSNCSEEVTMEWFECLVAAEQDTSEQMSCMALVEDCSDLDLACIEGLLACSATCQPLEIQCEQEEEEMGVEDDECMDAYAQCQEPCNLIASGCELASPWYTCGEQTVYDWLVCLSGEEQTGTYDVDAIMACMAIVEECSGIDLECFEEIVRCSIPCDQQVTECRDG